MNRVLIAVLMVLAIWAVVPVHAQPNCIAAIREATESHHTAIPAECWRIGPLTLGMTQEAVEAILGPPDLTEPAGGMNEGRPFTARRTLYAYPRDLEKRLEQNPIARGKFHPLTLRLVYDQNKLSAITVGDTARVDYGICVVRKEQPSPVARYVFPYKFQGIALGVPRSNVVASFGPFDGANNSKDFWNYWPIPISVGGEETLSEMNIASGMRFTGLGGLPHYVVDLDPATCHIRGYRLKPSA